MIPKTQDRKAVLSTLWIFALFNYLYADFVIMLTCPALYENMVAEVHPLVLLGLAALMEIPIGMIVLSRILGYQANRIANILAGIESTAFVGMTLLGGMIAPWYLFVALIEIACTLFIVWYAWTWRNPESQSA